MITAHRDDAALLAMLEIRLPNFGWVRTPHCSAKAPLVRHVQRPYRRRRRSDLSTRLRTRIGGYRSMKHPAPETAHTGRQGEANSAFGRCGVSGCTARARDSDNERQTPPRRPCSDSPLSRSKLKYALVPGLRRSTGTRRVPDRVGDPVWGGCVTCCRPDLLSHKVGGCLAPQSAK